MAYDHAAVPAKRSAAPSKTGDNAAFGHFALAVLASLALISFMVPPLVMAVAGAMMLAAGFGLATLLHLKGSTAESSWDGARLLVLMGFTSGTLCGAATFIS